MVPQKIDGQMGQQKANEIQFSWSHKKSMGTWASEKPMKFNF